MAQTPAPDYYAILGISPAASVEDIKHAYRTLALRHHPDRNQGKRSATVKFQQIVAAWDNLSDESKRRVYDANRPRDPASETDQQSTRQRQSQPANEKPKTENDMEREWREREESIAKRRVWLNWVEAMDGKMLDASNKIKTLESKIAAFDRLDQEQQDKMEAANSWWYPWRSKPVITEEDKRVMETERLQRLAARRVKSSELEKARAFLESMINERNKKEAIENARLKSEAIRRETKEREAKEKAEAEKRKMYVELLKKQREQAERMAKEREERMAKEREIRQREAEEREARQREGRDRAAAQATTQKRQAAREATRQKRPKSAQHKPVTTDNTSSCTHKFFWPKIEGHHHCIHCNATLYKFAFECPSCSTMACASCMRTLKSTGTSSNKFKSSSQRNYGTRYGDGSFWEHEYKQEESFSYEEFHYWD